MALLGDTHQYEALLGCRSSLPTGQSLSAFWNVIEACDMNAEPHASHCNITGRQPVKFIILILVLHGSAYSKQFAKLTPIACPRTICTD